MQRPTGKVNEMQTHSSLAGKSALVTGGGQRVGAAIAEALGRRGMHVALSYYRSDRGAQEVAERIRESGGAATVLQANLLEEGAGRALARQALDALGGLDLFVASAANFEKVDFETIDEAYFARAFRLNVLAGFEIVQEARPALRDARGNVVFITGYSTQSPYRGYLPYVVSKGAAAQMMRTLSLELAPEIRVNAVAPGTVLPPPDYSDAQVNELVGTIPLARVGSAEAVAEAVCYLAQADYTTGQELVVDGGKTVA